MRKLWVIGSVLILMGLIVSEFSVGLARNPIRSYGSAGYGSSTVVRSYGYNTGSYGGYYGGVGRRMNYNGYGRSNSYQRRCATPVYQQYSRYSAPYNQIVPGHNGYSTYGQRY